MSMRSGALALVAGFAVLALAGCNVVGKGNELESINIVPASASLTSIDDLKASYPSDRSYLCLSSQLSLYGFFSKGNSVGNFTRRAVWTSSDPSVVQVSTGTAGSLQYPGQPAGTFLSAGTVVPLKEGTATVTATYLDFNASIQIEVRTAESISISPADPRVAINSVQNMAVTATYDGFTSNITGAAVVDAALAAPDDNVAIVTVPKSNGLPTGIIVQGVSPTTEPKQLNVTLPFCNQTLTTSIRTAPLVGLTLQTEAGFGNDLVVGTSEFLKPMGDFGDGPEQDLRGQAATTIDTSADPNAASRINVSGGGFVLASAAGASVNVNATCCALDRNGDGDLADENEAATVTAPPITLNPVAGTLTSYAIDPANASGAQYNNPRFTALGTFDNGARTQPITRSMIWGSSDSTVLTFNTVFSTADENYGVGVLPRKTLTADTPITITGTLTPGSMVTTATSPVTTTYTVTPYVPPAP